MVNQENAPDDVNNFNGSDSKERFVSSINLNTKKQ